MKNLLYRIAYPILKMGWFIFRPRTRGVKILIFDLKGRVLMVRHNYGRGYWTFPGGGVHKGEDEIAAAIREIDEELGMKLIKVELLGVYQSNFEYKRDTVSVFKTVVEDAAVIKDDAEIAEVSWFRMNELPQFLSPRVQTMIDFVYEKNK